MREFSIHEAFQRYGTAGLTAAGLARLDESPITPKVIASARSDVLGGTVIGFTIGLFAGFGLVPVWILVIFPHSLASIPCGVVTPFVLVGVGSGVGYGITFLVRFAIASARNRQELRAPLSGADTSNYISLAAIRNWDS